ncbi:hypothetical protein BDN70DRAFT_938312 [Pholiota conissans]|uniref:Uncharacterized protein n=1 Tax=Pholiota conissans TaxID=109636 RepID=A0A9P5YN74_9AGAR|nr:hypothetical protein BDN70DRAFT_938312 [Pholiota conissans]
MSTVILDDRDSSIVYHGDTWVPSGNPAAEYLGTSMGTAPAFGTSATVAFTGTGITVFGTLNPGIQISMFSVDGAPPTTFTSTDASSIRYAQAFYTANPGTFSPGVHTLVMTPLQADFWLDFLKVDGPSATSSSTSSEALPNSIRSTSKSSAQAVPTVNSPPPKATNVNTSTSTSTSAPIKVSTASSTTSASFNIGPTIAKTEPTSSLIPASNNSASIPSDDSVQKQRNTSLNPIVGGALGGKVKMGGELPEAPGGDDNPPPPGINVCESQLRQRNSTVSRYDLSISTSKTAQISSRSANTTSEQVNEFNLRKTGNLNLSHLRSPDVSDPPPGYQPT